MLYQMSCLIYCHDDDDDDVLQRNLIPTQTRVIIIIHVSY